MKNIVVFGAGDVGRQICEILGREKIICYADNYPKSDTYLGLPLISFDELKKRYEADPEMIIIVASYDYCEEICYKLDKNNMGRHYTWPRAGAYTQNFHREYYHYSNLLDDYEVGKYKNIAIYSKENRLPFLFQLLSCRGFIDKVKYLIRHKDDIYKKTPFTASAVVCDEFDQIKDDIDLLLLDIRRDESKLHDIVECHAMPFAVANLRCYEKFMRSPEIIKFKNIHKGKRCFIVGNGSSLKIKDLEQLRRNGEICFGVNKIFYAFEETSWRPDYYLAQDTLMLMYYADELHDMDVPYKFIADRYPPYWETNPTKNEVKFHIKNETFVPNMPEFSGDFSAYSVEGATVTYSAMQLAAYMGFCEMYLIGMNFDYSGDMRNGENHFTPKYHTKGTLNKDEAIGIFALDKVLMAYKKAEIYSRLNGFRIFNATNGGKLEVFERVDFDSLFPERA